MKKTLVLEMTKLLYLEQSETSLKVKFWIISYSDKAIMKVLPLEYEDLMKC